MNQNQNKDNKKTKMTSKQIVALIGVVLLVLLYIATLITAFVDTSESGNMFGIALIASIFIPLLIWIYTWIFGKMTNKATMADLNIGGENHVTDEEVREIMIQQALAEQDTPY